MMMAATEEARRYGNKITQGNITFKGNIDIESLYLSRRHEAKTKV